MFGPNPQIVDNGRCPLYKVCGHYCPTNGINMFGLMKVLEGYLCRDHYIIIHIDDIPQNTIKAIEGR